MPERNTGNTDWRAFAPQGRSPAPQMRGANTDRRACLRVGGPLFPVHRACPAGACAFTGLVSTNTSFEAARAHPLVVLWIPGALRSKLPSGLGLGCDCFIKLFELDIHQIQGALDERDDRGCVWE